MNYYHVNQISNKSGEDGQTKSTTDTRVGYHELNCHKTIS